MKVSSLREFIRSLVAPLQQLATGAKAVTDLEQTCVELEPFAELEVWQFAEILRLAAHYRDNGTLPEPAKKKATPRKPAQPKHDPALVLEYTQKIRALEEKAATFETTREELREGLDELKLDKLSKDNLVSIARELSRPVTGKTNKKDAVEMLRRLVLERKEVLEGALT